MITGRQKMTDFENYNINADTLENQIMTCMYENSHGMIGTKTKETGDRQEESKDGKEKHRRQ
jgi:hypothetical protein